MDYTSYPKPNKKHRDTFIYGLMDDLVEYGLKAPLARSIAGAVCELMSRDDLYYHNYIHPLAMFDFARKNGISLSLRDRLVVYFHDVIYYPSDADLIGGQVYSNEQRSRELFQRMVPHIPGNEHIWNHIQWDITLTERHLDKKFSPHDNLKILDLDLHSFGLPYNDFKHCAQLVQKELGTTPQQSIAFYDLLLARSPIFRTSEFSRFEQTALDNIQRYKFEYSEKVPLPFKDIGGRKLFQLDGKIFSKIEDGFDLAIDLENQARFWINKDVECLTNEI